MCDTPDKAKRKASLESKKLLIVTAIEDGKIEVEDYASALRQSILNDKMLGQMFLKSGNKVEANYCFARAKVMEGEMEG
jgi:hypothetical protein